MIALENISFIQEERMILNGLHLEVGDRERLVILGASGSGKTTLLRMIAGFITPDEGIVRIDGEVVSQKGKIVVPPRKRGLNMVFQDLALWSHMDVYENIAFGLKMQGVTKKERQNEVTNMLETVHLKGYEKRRIDTLSGGEKQRVALARALVTKPKILLMDEPLSSLDSKLNQELRRELVRLQEHFGFTLVYVTHSETEAREIATRAVKMKEGRVSV